MNLDNAIKSLIEAREAIDKWVQLLGQANENDLNRFYKKGIKAPGVRVRALIKNSTDELNLIRRDILRHRKEMEIFQDTKSYKNYKKTKRSTKK